MTSRTSISRNSHACQRNSPRNSHGIHKSCPVFTTSAPGTLWEAFVLHLVVSKASPGSLLAILGAHLATVQPPWRVSWTPLGRSRGRSWLPCTHPGHGWDPLLRVQVAIGRVPARLECTAGLHYSVRLEHLLVVPASSASFVRLEGLEVLTTPTAARVSSISA